MEERYKSLRRRDVTLGKHDRESLNAMDAISLKNIAACADALAQLIEDDANGPQEIDADAQMAVASELFSMWHDVARITSAI